MGWLFRSAQHFKRSGRRVVIDRKKECDELWETTDNRYTVLKSSMVGRVYYAAVSVNKIKTGTDANGNDIYTTVPENQRQIFASIILTATNHNDFGYKDMDETCGPFYNDCPICILDMLTDTTSDNALKWREACRQRHAEKNSDKNPGKLPIGTIIRFDYDGETVELKKMPPGYQFKTPWWFDAKNHAYMQKKRIPDDFEIVSRP